MRHGSRVNILSRIFGRERSPVWEFSPGGLIWKLQPTRTGLLFGESRDVENKRLTLFAVSASDGAPRFHDLELHEPWWIALETVIGDVAVMHRYPRPDLPTAVGAVAVDSRDGRILWTDETIRILCGVEEIALAQRGSSFEYEELLFVDLGSGTVLEEIGGNIERAVAFQSLCDDRQRWSGWIPASQLTEEHPRFESLSAIVSRSIGDRRGAIETAEFGGHTVLAVHERSRRSAQAMLSGTVDGVLLVVAGNDVIYRETIVRDAPAPSEDGFFIWNGMVIFIREGRTLVAIDLNKE